MSLPRQPRLSEIDLHWTDEQIISLLKDYLPGSRLPENVLEDSSPFLYPPSNLPEGVWYLVHSNERKESFHGFWKAKGEACKVCSNTVINGWRSTLEYFEGLAPDGQITDWVMHEYVIAPKELNDKDKAEVSRLLCRVFLSKGETSPQNCKTIVEPKNIKPSSSITSDQDAGKEPQVKIECEVESGEEFDEADCISRGDFLELNDLESHSSSSSSYLSEEYSAFLRDIEKNIKEEEEKRVGRGGTLSPPSSNKAGGGGGGGGGGSSRMNKLLRTYFCFATF